MPDFSYQALMQLMPQMQQQPSLWNGIAQAPQTTNDPSLLAMMLAKQRQQQGGQTFMPELNPGQTWGNRDQNAIQPNDVMLSRTLPQAPDNI